MNPTKQAFPAAIVDAVRQVRPLADWLGYYKDFDNWTRLSACLSLASYFERYIQKTVRLAISSDPGVILGKSRAIDGAVFLRAGAFPFDLKPYIEGFTKGTWQSRLENYQRLFGTAPTELSGVISDLDHLRVLRNSVGHRFGRAIEDDDSLPLVGLEEPERLSRKRLVTWLGIVEGATTAIDAHLRSNHIGAYEVLEAYSKVNKEKFSNQWEERRLAKYFPSLQGVALGDGYCRDAITHFERQQ